ncbi:hypothetical protein SAMN05428945_4248 [Streptomyces sp. 2224.1]|nr:hypothetical protein BX261_1090 [Streptomyces sp. 2321.6]SDR55908.1 hypothetical protein SAMN05216511_6127 [Streptomyces sp. KS_16]SEC06598.1 hypothetical protein SAMN05428940_1089 [Streptomyces sp. 2133.1]SED22679.1 hypothetical protein SAMN05428945_4248 [Streptomyces sp. 2224.1]SEF09416.1 hypothetical protein SAMN05428954_6187 [Streptomyces sp. 2112.3]SNC64374.1 hypothetical protein SAMN06272741_1088 [Streptomyces sp. 2114.4]
MKSERNDGFPTLGARRRPRDPHVTRPQEARLSTQETSQVLVALDACIAAAREGQSGALWRLTQSNRQLDANLVRLPAGTSVAGHVEAELDVLLIVIEGDGQLDNGTRAQTLESGVVAWLPKSAHRALVAGPRGLVYLTVHRRRPGLSIGGRAADEGGEAPCAQERACRACGHPRAEAGARFCSWCGEEVPTTPAL